MAAAREIFRRCAYFVLVAKLQPIPVSCYYIILLLLDAERRPFRSGCTELLRRFFDGLVLSEISRRATAILRMIAGRTEVSYSCTQNKDYHTRFHFCINCTVNNSLL
jgi:hypothetical protein